MSDHALSCEGLTRRFDSGTALDALSLDARPGEVLALLGPNGAGKTTTMRLLNGVLLPDAGTATVLGLDPWRQGEDLRARTGVLTENAGLDERLTARENLAFVARLRGLPATLAEPKISELLDRFGMGHRADVLVQGFSTGQRKRVALARALLHDPELLFLDEPTSGLDPVATRDVVNLISSLATEHGRTVVLCTHFLGEAGRLANRMAVLFEGKLHAFGAPSELAGDLWKGIEVRIDLGRTPPTELLTNLANLRAVTQVVPIHGGVLARIAGRDAVPTLVSACVEAGERVFAAEPREPTLEDVYFEIESRASGSTTMELAATPIAPDPDLADPAGEDGGPS